MASHVPTIDAHHHFWNREQVPWLTPELGALYRDYLPDDLEPELRAAGVERTVLVQAVANYADTDAMLERATRYPLVGAVVGWVPLDTLAASAEAQQRLDGFQRHPAFRGVRPELQDQPDVDWMLSDDVLAGIGVVAERGLTLDLLGYTPHLQRLPTIAERFPSLTIIVDHLCKPPIRTGEREPWATSLRAAARHPNVVAKLAGLATEADPQNWSAATLKPYIDIALDAFGPERLMWGSDWPVSLLAGGYGRMWAEWRRAVADLSQAEQAALFGGTAARVYRIGGSQQEGS